MKGPNVRKWYKLEDAKHFGIEWKDWRDITVKVGEWIKSDDDYVAMATKQFSAKDSNGYPKYVIHTVLGGFSQTRKDKLLFFESAKFLSEMNKFDRRSNKATARERAVIDLVVSGVDPVSAIASIFPHVTPDQRKYRYTSLVKKESVVRYMTSKLKDALAAEGVDEEYVIRNMKELIEKGRDTVKIETLKLALMLQGHLGKRIEQKKTTAQIHFDEEDVALLEGERTEGVAVDGLLTDGSDDDAQQDE